MRSCQEWEDQEEEEVLLALTHWQPCSQEKIKTFLQASSEDTGKAGGLPRKVQAKSEDEEEDPQQIATRTERLRDVGDAPTGCRPEGAGWTASTAGPSYRRPPVATLFFSSRLLTKHC